MKKLADFMLREALQPCNVVTVEVEIECKTLEEVLEWLMVMPPLSQYPVTVDWPEQAESYKAEIDLLEACLNRAPDLAWYCHFLNLAKPYILERSRLARSKNDTQKIMGGTNEQLVSTQQTFIP